MIVVRYWLSRLMSIAAALSFVTSSMPVRADETGDLWRETTLELIEALVQQGILTRQKADDILRRSRERAAARTAPKVEAGDVRVTHVPETVKDTLREQVRNDVLARAKAEHWGVVTPVPEWTERLRFSGEIMLRSQSDFFGNANSTQVPDYDAFNAAGTLNIPNGFLYTDPADPNRVQDDRHRLRLRARLAMDVRMSDRLSGGLRLTTGVAGEPTVTIQTAGTSFNRYAVTFDRVFLRYRPTEWIELSGGRIPNPLLSTELVWFQELGFEGISATVRPEWRIKGMPWATLGAFPLQELGSPARNKWLYAAQGGVDWDVQADGRARVALAYYSYAGITGRRNPSTGNTHLNDYTAPAFLSKGNTLFNIADTTADPNAARFALASEFRLMNVTGTLDLPAMDRYRLVLTGDYVRNLGFDAAQVAARAGTPVSAETSGYLLRMGFGRPELAESGQWLGQFGYRRIERDAVLDVYNDPFFHLGGTDAKGYDLTLAYAIERATTLQLRWTKRSSRPAPLAGRLTAGVHGSSNWRSRLRKAERRFEDWKRRRPPLRIAWEGPKRNWRHWSCGCARKPRKLPWPRQVARQQDATSRSAPASSPRARNAMTPSIRSARRCWASTTARVFSTGRSSRSRCCS
ncbi:MAG: putative porin [Betaproteobacteria bacterium]|nr:putative porin [Betaproteobacteria bacterium]